MMRVSLDRAVTIAVGAIALGLGAVVIHDRVARPAPGEPQLANLPEFPAATRASNGPARVGSDLILRWALLGNLIGRRDAPVRIIEFGTFECEFCARLQLTLVKEMKKYPDLISIRWINAVTKTGPEWAYANAGECAAQQGKFEAFHDYVFAQAYRMGTDEEFYRIAKNINVPDSDRFAACLEAAAGETRVGAEADEAACLGIVRTPTWFVNGFPVVGDADPDSVDALIVRELQRARSR